MTLKTFTDPDYSRLLPNTYSTGIDGLDVDYLQGIPYGSVVGIIADPRVQYELFNYHLVHTDRPTEYVSTVRPGRLITQDIESMGTIVDGIHIEDVFGSRETAKNIILKHVGRIEEGHNYILDTVGSYYLLEENPDMFLQTLRNVYTTVHDKNAIAYLNFTNIAPAASSEYIQEAIGMCDGIFNLTQELKSRDIETFLEIKRMRKRSYPSERIKIETNNILTIDTTQNIA